MNNQSGIETDIKSHIEFEVYRRKKNTHADNVYLTRTINDLLKRTWGMFPDDFVDRHILQSDKIVEAKLNGACIGFCAINIKNLLGLKIHYVEFLIIDPEYQKIGVGSYLFYKTLQGEIVRSLPSLLIGKPCEIFFITPNIRVLSMTAKFASFIYPNPLLAKPDGSIQPADELTWKIATYLLQKSDNPGRKLDIEGLVLHGSYATTPWLIYNNDTAPWHSDEKLNVFARRYLGYHAGEDKEFMVRAHITLFSVFKYLHHEYLS